MLDRIQVQENYWNGTTTTKTLYFAGGMYEIQDAGEVGEKTLKYYSIAGMRVAMDDGTDLVYFATDHLSSTSISLDVSGTLLSEQRYKPFGELRTDVGLLLSAADTGFTDFGYTGQRDLGDVGLMDYNARFYSPKLGRFIQPDTIIPNPGDSQAWNRYSYVKNNPIKYLDPTGYCEVGSYDDPCDVSGTGDLGCNIYGNCSGDNGGNGGGNGNGGHPGNIDVEITLLVCGTDGVNSGNIGPECGGDDGQMIPWTEYIGSDYWIQYQGGKEATADEIYVNLVALNVDGSTSISLICYSGGADACEIFYDKYSDQFNITTMVLMGASPSPSGGYKGGDLSTFSLGILTDAVNDGVNVLFLDDIGILPKDENGNRWAPTIDPNGNPGYWVSTAGQCHHKDWACGTSTNSTNNDPNLITNVLNWVANPGPSFPYP